jgi:hypothetical protein
MLKLYAREKNCIIRNSMFGIRYSLRAYRKFIVLELPTIKELAKHLHPKRLGIAGASPNVAYFLRPVGTK